MFLDFTLEILLANIHKKYLSRIKKNLSDFKRFPANMFLLDSGHCHIYNMELFAKAFLQKTAFAKSSILEIYLTDSSKFASD